MRTKRPPTKPVRIAGDLAEMLSEIIHHDRINGVVFLDPMIRPGVEARFAKLPKPNRDQALARIAAQAN